MIDGQVTRETLDLIMALRPFTGPRGQKIIDTLAEIAQSSSGSMEAFNISNLAVRAKNLLAERIDSAVSLSLLLAAAWLGSSIEAYASEQRNPAG
ncbi:MAG TPA: hypothetical protein GXX23_03850 [Firmicutes bacterium]|nr:hypothetical protein [Candidatus Fermentithermobacillaceae bacterium]